MKKLFLTLALIFAAAPAMAADLDISQYKETFSETFRGQLDVSPWGPSKWIAHTPWNGDYGDARFADPQPGFPFITGPGGLKIMARKDINGKWAAGLLSTLDSHGHGFSQIDGYFEVRMKVPPGPGVWPAFWLVGGGDENNKSEIDIIEYYGHEPDRYHAGYILWPKASGVEHKGDGKAIISKMGPLSDAYHTYGLEIQDKEIVYYFDRHEAVRFPADPAMHSPHGILLNLALGPGWPLDKTPNPSTLEVDYVKAFKRK